MRFKNPTGKQYREGDAASKRALGYFGLFIGIIWDTCLEEIRDSDVFEISWHSAGGEFGEGNEWGSDGDLSEEPHEIHERPRTQKMTPAMPKKADHNKTTGPR